jgi:hypothetical protein
MGIKGEGMHIQGIDNLFNKHNSRKLSQSQEKEGHPGTGGFQNTKQAGSENNMPRNIIIKTLNIWNKERILKAAEEK